MIVAFVLSMPGSPSWNGKWSGEGRLYAVVKNVGTTKKAEEKYRKIIDGGPFYYSWSDGWRARIDVKQVTSTESADMRKKSVGFSGYEWMIETICQYGTPLADHEIGLFLAAHKQMEILNVKETT